MNELDLKSLKKTVFTRAFLLFILFVLVFFFTAGTLKYWEGWAYMLVVAIIMAIFGTYLFKYDPELLERRMRTKETRKEQKLVLKLSFILFPLIYILPGFDKRFGWSEVPVSVEIIALLLVSIGYIMTISVLKANSYASRVVEVDERQKVISTGPYAYVRHPMYTSLIVFYLFTPIALGSYWAVIPAVFLFLVLILRIFGEEEELLKNLEGYREYMQKVKYRLIPGIW